MAMEAVLAGLFVFFMRVTDMSLDTLRMLFTMRGRKLLAGGIGVVQAAVFILAVSAVLKGPLNFWTVLGYATGFGTGVMLGIVVEERLAVGYEIFHIYSVDCGPTIVKTLREAGHAATEFTGQGKLGSVTLVNSIVSRKDIPAVKALVDKADPRAFVTLESVQPLRRGYFRH